MATIIGTLTALVRLDETQLQKGLTSSQNRFQNFTRSTVNSLKSIAATFGIVAGATGVGLLAKSAVEAGVNLDSLRRSLKAIFGTYEQAGKELEFLAQTADKYGLSLAALRSSYKSLTAATKETSVEGEATKNVFIAVAKASTVLGLTADQTQGALYALSQMASKGAVQMEELRRQLGERLYGAFQLAARGLGMTTEELNKYMALGQLAVDEFFPAFAAEVERTFGEGVADAAESARANFFRLGNTMLQLKETVGEAVLPALIDATKGIREWVDVNEKLLKQELPIYLSQMVNALADAGPLVGKLTIAFINLLAWPSRMIEGIDYVKKGMMDFSDLMNSNAEELVEVFEIIRRNKDIFELQGQIAEVREELDAVKNRADFTGFFVTDEAQAEVAALQDKLKALEDELATMSFVSTSVWEDFVPDNAFGYLDRMREGWETAFNELDLLAGQSHQVAQYATRAMKEWKVEVDGAGTSVEAINDLILEFNTSLAVVESGVFPDFIENFSDLEENIYDAEGATQAQNIALALGEERMQEYGAALDDLKSTFDATREGVMDLADSLDRVPVTVNAVGSAFNVSMGNALEVTDELGAVIQNSLIRDMRGAGIETENLGLQINTLDGGILDLGEGFEDAGKVIVISMQAAGAAIEDVGETTTDTTTEMTKYVEDRYEQMTDNIQNTMSDAFADIFRGNFEGWSGLFNRIGDAFIDMLADMVAKSLMTSTAVTGAFSTIEGGIGNIINGFGSLFKLDFSGFLGNLSTGFGDLFDFVGKGIKTVIGGFGNLFGLDFSGFLNNLSGGFSGLFNNIINGIDYVIRAFMKLLTLDFAGFLSNLAGGFNSVFSGIGSTLNSITGGALGNLPLVGGLFTGGTAGGTTGAITGLEDALAGIPTPTGQFATGGTLASFGSGLLNALPIAFIGSVIGGILSDQGPTVTSTYSGQFNPAPAAAYGYSMALPEGGIYDFYEINRLISETAQSAYASINAYIETLPADLQNKINAQLDDLVIRAESLQQIDINQDTYNQDVSRILTNVYQDIIDDVNAIIQPILDEAIAVSQDSFGMVSAAISDLQSNNINLPNYSDIQAEQTALLADAVTSAIAKVPAAPSGNTNIYVGDELIASIVASQLTGNEDFARYIN